MSHQLTVEALIHFRVLYLVKDKKKKNLLGKDSEGLRGSSRFLSVFGKRRGKPCFFSLLPASKVGDKCYVFHQLGRGWFSNLPIGPGRAKRT